jgi:hypothetical protein
VKPLSFSDALDRVWTIMRRHWLLFVQLGTIPVGGLFLWYALVIGGMFAFGVIPRRGQVPDPQQLVAGAFSVMLVAFIPWMALFALFEAAVCMAALGVIRGGITSFTQAYAAGWGRLGRLLWLMVLRWLCIALPMAGVFGLMGGVLVLQILQGKSNLNPGIYFLVLPFILIGYAGSIVYAIWMMLRLSVAVPACLAEEKTALEALRRSAALTHGAKGRIFLVLLVVYAVSCAATMAAEMIGFAVAALVTLIGSGLHMHLAGPLAWIVIAILGTVLFAACLLIMALSWASFVITFCVFYDHQRLRFEGAAPAIAG